MQISEKIKTLGSSEAIGENEKVGVKTLEEKKRYISEVGAILEHGYRKLTGGIFTALENQNALLDPRYLGKLCIRGGSQEKPGYVSAVCIYKGSYTDRKLVVCSARRPDPGNDGQGQQSRADLISLLRDDLKGKKRGAGIEVSDDLEKIYANELKATAHPVDEAQYILAQLSKDTTAVDDTHYKRQIGAHEHIKSLYGNVPDKYLKGYKSDVTDNIESTDTQVIEDPEEEKEPSDTDQAVQQLEQGYM